MNGKKMLCISEMMYGVTTNVDAQCVSKEVSFIRVGPDFTDIQHSGDYQQSNVFEYL